MLKFSLSPESSQIDPRKPSMNMMSRSPHEVRMIPARSSLLPHRYGDLPALPRLNSRLRPAINLPIHV